MPQQNADTPQPPGEPESPVTPDMIASAEQVIGLRFTEAERAQMRGQLGERLKQYESLRTQDLANSVAPPVYFDPRPLPPSSGKVKRLFHMSDQPPVERPANLEAVAFWPLTKLAQLIRSKQVSSLELTEMYLARLKRYDAHLHCVVTFTEDLAMQQAKRADEEIAAGVYRGPLHGIPWGAKDLLAVRGYKTTWGAMPYKDQVIDLDAAVVQRLEEAGAVLIAKLTLGALAYGDIWFGGRTNNPWDLSQGSSGSSAGSAAATAAGLVGFSIGTETLGSIVSPSTRCGTTGLRPTFGRVPRTGAMALVWSMDKIGPICRGVEDCALVFSAIYGPDGADSTVVDLPFLWNPNLRPADLRVGYFKRAFEESPPADAEDTSTWTNSAASLEVLRGLGLDLVEVDLPQVDVDALDPILFAEAAAAFDEITRHDLDDQMQWQDDDAWPNSFRAARFIPAVEYIQANRLRALLMQQMAAVMEAVDVFVTPSFGGKVLQITNYSGHPAVVAPNGFTSGGAPTSISFIGGLYQEAATLAVAKAYQDATDFHLRYPPLQYGE